MLVLTHLIDENMDFSNIMFRRNFSMTLYKNRKIRLAQMSFTKDFVNDKRGDLYPIIEKSDDCNESLENNRYVVSSGNVKRWFCRFFPYASYEIAMHLSGGKAGLCFGIPGVEACVMLEKNSLIFICGQEKETLKMPDYVEEHCTVIVSLRPQAFDIFFEVNGQANTIIHLRQKHSRHPMIIHCFQTAMLLLMHQKTLLSKK